MSYDVRISVKVQGCDKYAVIETPEKDSPTYNLTKMFRECMSWDFEQSYEDENQEYQKRYYRCDGVIDKLEHGIRELSVYREYYEQYNPPNGWGTLDGALACMKCWRDCIYELAEEYPLECMYFSW